MIASRTTKVTAPAVRCAIYTGKRHFLPQLPEVAFAGLPVEVLGERGLDLAACLRCPYNPSRTGEVLLANNQLSDS